MSSLSIQPVTGAGATLRLRRVSVDEYHRMIRDGYFAENERFELVDGLILEKMSKNPPHATVTSKLRRQIEPQLSATCFARVQDPVTLTRSEPEPDIAVVRGTEDDYVARHPGVRDVLLLIEVSDSTLDVDLGLKLAEYAREGIEPYVVVNIPDQRVEVRTGPSADGTYRFLALHANGEGTIELPVGATRVSVDVAALFSGLDG